MSKTLIISDIHGEYDSLARVLDERYQPGDTVRMLGDVYDRGPLPDQVMEALMALPNIHIQWGNHDIVWMGAALGQRGCIANVVRICARYGNLSVLEENYGLDLGALTDFALSAYGDDPCVAFGLKGSPQLDPADYDRHVKVQKAIAYLQWKVEHCTIAENPCFELEHRDLLDKIDFAEGTVAVDGGVHALGDPVMPTVDPADPFRMTPEEEQVMTALEAQFLGCQKLQRHIRFFLEAGSLYDIDGTDLLLHACVPLNADGTLMETELYGQKLSGKALYDAVDGYVRDAFTAEDPEEKKRGLDLLWYLWLGPASPLFAKSKMATFELYQIADKAARKEVKNAFYTLYEEPAVVDGILADFGLPAGSRILCGHVPVKVKDGEDPVKCAGQVLVLDGGFACAYRPNTGVAGFVLEKDAAGSCLIVNELDGSQTIRQL